MKALLLSAYDAQSHRVWRENLYAMLPQIEWVTLTLPPRYFPWRVRGNSLTWAFNHRLALTDNYDFLLCTSMTDLSALRGFVPELARLPTIVYCHENQFAYPENPDPQAARTNPVEPQILSIYTALCADRLVFNSTWNQHSFLDGAAALLRKLPDQVPGGLVERLSQSSVLPVPLSPSLFAKRQAESPPEELTIVWNHRWEYDKGPALLLAITDSLMARGLRFRLHLLGQRFRQAPPEFVALQECLAHYCQSQGIAPGRADFIEDREEYRALLASSDVVLSTALHDFQGLSVLEASALGCVALAPERLVYPEYLGPENLYAGAGNVLQQADSAAQRLADWGARKAAGLPPPIACVNRFHPDALRAGHEALIHDLLSRPSS